MTFTCTKCGNYSDDGDFEAEICLRCIDDGADKDQEQREWHHIDVPMVRPLTPNEQKVYSLLRMGYTAKEVARQLHMPYGDEFFCNVHDVTCDTVRHLITSIREKGWDIPEKENEEGEDMQKYTNKQKEKVYKLYDEGKAPKEISIKMKLPYKSVWKWCDTYKKQKQFEQNIEDGSKATLADMEGHPVPTAETNPQEMVISAEEHNEIHSYKDKKEEPASAATDTDSGEKHFGNVSAPIIPENIEPVKSRYFSDDTITAIEEKIAALSAKQEKVIDRMLNKYAAIEKISASIAVDDAECNRIQLQIDGLKDDLDVICGGVIGE